MLIIGIDPGVSGGIVTIEDGKLVAVIKMPETYPDIYETLRDCIYNREAGDVTAYLEDVGQGIPGQSSKATASFARHNGHLEMALYALGIRTEKIKPQKWMKFYSGSIGKSSSYEKREWKNRLKAEAQRLFPAEKVTLWNADAILLANYGSKQP